MCVIFSGTEQIYEFLFKISVYGKHFNEDIGYLLENVHGSMHVDLYCCLTKP